MHSTVRRPQLKTRSLSYTGEDDRTGVTIARSGGISKATRCSWVVVDSEDEGGHYFDARTRPPLVATVIVRALPLQVFHGLRDEPLVVSNVGIIEGNTRR